MRTGSRWQLAFLSLSLTALFVTCPFAMALPPSYAIVDLGASVNTVVDAAVDINTSGQVVHIRDGADRLWTSGMSALIASPANGPLAINNLGHAAGGAGNRGFFFNGVVTVQFGQTGDTYFTDLNNSDIVVGYSYRQNLLRNRGFIWHNFTAQDLSAPTPNSETIPHSINDAGDVVGSADNFAYLWRHDGTTASLSPVGGYGFAVATSVNANVEIAGFSWDSFISRATVWTDGVAHDLGTLAGMGYSRANAINSRGEVVGFASANNGTFDRAFVWEHGGPMLDLNSVSLSQPGWILTAANGINDLGQIVGLGYLNGQPHSFLITPTPEPSAELAMTVFGALATKRRRARAPRR